MTESERNLSRSHNPNLNSDNFEHLDEQNRIINLLNPHFDCTDLPRAFPPAGRRLWRTALQQTPFRRLVVPARSVLRRTAAPLSD